MEMLDGINNFKYGVTVFGSF